jgi:hypothetical protein
MKKNINIHNFVNEGLVNFGSIIDQKKCTKLRNQINSVRPCNKKIFFSTYPEFKKKGRFEKYSPGGSFNALTSLKFDLDFIEKSDTFTKAVESIMGKNFKILKKTIIRSVPKNFMPDWISKYIEDIGRPNLNPYIKPKYQDVQYFYNADFHQDMTRGKKFATFYIYLDEVKKKDSALKILKKSHYFGASFYPHYIRKSNDKQSYFYSDLKGNHLKCEEFTCTGKAGNLLAFHGLALHGSYYNFSKDPRISLRYLICPSTKSKNTIFRKSFLKIKNYPIKINNKFARLDRDLKSGTFKKTGMTITY